ncbi:hypothetical protein SAMN02745355_1309 [Picrophilus oshimae DSM 9789]|uniref:Glycosyltransferase, catalytic subunit of cellulose synthase and poly-beta-1,6-N-acetylglucosamine synthase n=1 Tax=Picrophilus torridus (strain ATCC 700027 / DSM 9790 / JCM 10055 / NBRC 100828 / KAW 2/3) TaxID=1122961 RepID=A0A8G2L7Q9_PICTO|nr:hypothetical protein SAMN02745355_1309 [Picrophilus oshimae DSM 9789]
MILIIIYIIFLILISAGFLYIEFHPVKNCNRYGDYNKSCLVIVPCRGIDYSLEENLRSITDQNYKNYNVLCVVDDDKDQSLNIIKRLNIDYIKSDYHCKNCSGKVRAIATALSKYVYDSYVIADSDITVNKDWLENLLRPLSSEDIGISTTFPYFMPVAGFWSRVKELWGFVGQGLMESDLTRFGWGGSLAFKRDLIDNKIDFFSEHVSDDTVLTKMCKSQNKKIAYVKSAMPVVNSPEHFNEFYEWANRQTALSISASRKVLYYGLLFFFSYMFLFFSGIIMGIFYSPLFFLFLIPCIVYISKSILRLKKFRPIYIIIGIMIPFIYTSNLIKASRMKNIMWRGRIYNIDDKSLL